MKRTELINEIVKLSGDEYETKQDYLNLAYLETDELDTLLEEIRSNLKYI